MVIESLLYSGVATSFGDGVFVGGAVVSLVVTKDK
jgi:hypothetical protein